MTKGSGAAARRARGGVRRHAWVARAGPETRRGRARRGRARRVRPGGGRRRRAASCWVLLFPELACGAHPGGRRTGVGGDLAGASARSPRPSSSASGVRPQTHTGRSGGQMQPCARAARKRFTRRSSSEWKEIPAKRPFWRRTPTRAASAASSWPSSSLTAIRIAWNVRLAGWPPANRAGAGIAAAITSTSALVDVESARARARARCARAIWPRVALLAVLAEDACARRRSSHVLTISAASSSCVGVHAHVQRRVVGVGEAALPRVDLHRGHAEVEVDEVGRDALVAQQLRRPSAKDARTKRVAQDTSAASCGEVLLGGRVAVDRDERAGRARCARRRGGRGRRRRTCSRRRSRRAAGRAARSARPPGRGHGRRSCHKG